MRWWCSQLFVPWTWTPRPYLGVWAIMAVVVVMRVRARRRRQSRRDLPKPTRRQSVAFWFAVFGFWLASDWPIGALGAGYLASVHMFQYVLYTFMVAPLLVLAAPEAWTRERLIRWRLGGLVEYAAHPFRAAIFANAVLLATHAPWTVDQLRASQIGSFALDIVWLVGGLVAWYPVLAPIPEHRVKSPPLRSAYLFVAAGISSLIPAGFLTFANNPLYRSYEIAPRVGLDPLDDQQLAGAIMKVGGLPVVWITMAVIWVRWANTERTDEYTRVRRSPQHLDGSDEVGTRGNSERRE